MNIHDTSNTTDHEYVPSAPQVHVHEQVAYNPEINLINPNQPAAPAQQVLQPIIIQQCAAKTSRNVRVRNLAHSNGSGGAIYQFDSTVPSELEQIGLNEQLFAEYIDQVNTAMKELFSTSHTLSKMGGVVVIAGIVTFVVGGIIAASTQSNFPIGVYIGFLMGILGIIILVVASSQEDSQLSKQVGVLNQHCQRLTKECKKMNIQVVWKPVHGRTETETDFYSDIDGHINGHSETYHFYDIEIHY